MNLDSKGLIVQVSGDGGDTLQREGFWFEGIFLNPEHQYSIIQGMAPYITALTRLDTPQGFVRNPTLPYNDPSDTSRDQLVSNIRACGYYKYTQYLKFIFWSCAKNFSRYPNGDIAFLQDYGRFIRAFKLWFLYPLLPGCDIFILINSIIRCIQGRDLNNVGDDINHIGDLAQAQEIYPTPVSWLARKIYKWLRPSFTPHVSGPQYALNWYFRAASGGNPEFASLWSSIVMKF